MLRALAVIILCMASENDRRRYIELSPGRPFSDRALAQALNISPKSMRNALQKLEDDEVFGLPRLKDGTIFLQKFSKSNPDDPTAIPGVPVMAVGPPVPALYVELNVPQEHPGAWDTIRASPSGLQRPRPPAGRIFNHRSLLIC